MIMLEQSPRGSMQVEASLGTSVARARLVHYRFPSPPDSMLHSDDVIRIELALTPRHRSARASYRDLWAVGRYEPIGEIFVVPPQVTMLARSDEASDQRAVVCELQLQSVLALFRKSPPSLCERHLRASLDVRSAQVRQLLLRLAWELQYPGFASQVLAESVATQLQIELFRYGLSEVEERVRGGLASWQLRAIDERLAEAMAAPSLHELATLCNLSVRQLTRGFRASRGTALGPYIADRQAQHAMRLLNGSWPVVDIARMLGFASASNFCLAFRKVTGVTPGRFRRSQSPCQRGSTLS
jgi:AraC family transcriptional regulator